MDSKREITVGGLVVLGIILFVVGTMWLKGKAIGPKNLVSARYTDVGNLKMGAPVKISGVSVGKVQEILFEDVGKVIVSFNLPPNVKPKIDATAVIYDVGFLGDAAIRFDPGKSAEPLPKGEVLPGVLYGGMGAIINDLSGDARKTMDAAQKFLDPALVKDLRHTLSVLDRTLEVYGDTRNGPAPALKATLDSVQALSGRMHALLANPALDRAVNNLDSLTSNATRMTAQLTATGARLDSLLADIRAGKGTIGKFASDTGLYVDTRNTLQSLRALLDSLNKNPGKLTVNVKLF